VLFVFLGGRDPRLRNAVDAVLGHPEPDDLAYTHLDGARTGPDELNAACGAVSMFGERRKIFLDGASPSGPQARKLIQWLAAFGDAQKNDPGTDTCDLAVAVYLDLGDRRTSARVKAFSALTGHGGRVQQFGPLRDAEAARFVRSEARRAGVNIVEEAADRLVELMTSDAGLLSSEVEKLAAYVGFRGEISMRDVNAACATIGEHARWDYVNALADRRGAEALAVLHDMLALRTPHEMILADITRSLRQLAAARQAVAEGGTYQQIARAAGAPPSRGRYLAQQAQRISDRLIARMYAEVVRTDAALKSTGGDKDALLEILTARLATRPADART
jgi:DNA polymerase-3 subunit delta